MKKGSGSSNRGRIAAAVCAVIVLAGETAGIKMLHAYSDDEAAAADNVTDSTAVGKNTSEDNGVISAGDMIKCSIEKNPDGSDVVTDVQLK